ncbi:MAG: hypothetical protein ACREQQ_08815, partial [Candidatus Binatia bacterium]
PDVAFLPVSKMVYDYRHGGVNSFCRYLDVPRYHESFQYTGSAEDAAEWTDILRPRWVCPYAVFAFRRWSMGSEIVAFARALGRVGLENRLYPLRPLDVLEGEGQSGFGTALRRRLRLLGYRIAERLLRYRRRLESRWTYRLLSRALDAARAERGKRAAERWR